MKKHISEIRINANGTLQALTHTDDGIVGGVTWVDAGAVVDAPKLQQGDSGPSAESGV